MTNPSIVQLNSCLVTLGVGTAPAYKKKIGGGIELDAVPVDLFCEFRTVRSDHRIASLAFSRSYSDPTRAQETQPSD